MIAVPFRMTTMTAGRRRAFRAEMSAANEVPVVTSPATGAFRARLSDDEISFA